MIRPGQKIFLVGVVICVAVALVVVYFLLQPLHIYQKSHQKMPKLFSMHDEIQDCSYDQPGNNSCYDVVPRTAYYDNRIVSGKPHHTVYVLTEMKDSQKAADSIVACEINGLKYRKVEVRKDSTWWIQKNFPGKYPYCSHYIRCHNVPQESVHTGDIVKVIYRKMGTTSLLRVTTEKPLVLTSPAGPSDFTKGKGSVVVCITLFGRPPYFNEWLKYQKTLGVDKVHMSVDESFAENATSFYPFLQEALVSGYAEMEVWKKYAISDKVYYYSQTLKYVDCFMKYIGIYEYGLFYDSDDFFNPKIPNQKDIHYYVNYLFSNSKTASVRIKMHNYKCRAKQELYKNRTDGNITDSLTNYSGFWVQDPISIHRLNRVEFVHVHEAINIFSGFKTADANREKVYIAHIRPEKEC